MIFLKSLEMRPLASRDKILSAALFRRCWQCPDYPYPGPGHIRALKGRPGSTPVTVGGPWVPTPTYEPTTPTTAKHMNENIEGINRLFTDLAVSQSFTDLGRQEWPDCTLQTPPNLRSYPFGTNFR